MRFYPFCDPKTMRANSTTHVCCLLFLIFNLESAHCHGNHRHHSHTSLSKRVDVTHTDHPEDVNGNHSGEIPDHRYFLTELFSKYGHNGVMTFEGFEHLLESLQLGGIIIKDHDLSSHRERDNEFRNNHAHHEHKPSPNGQETSPTETIQYNHAIHGDSDDHVHDNIEEFSGDDYHSRRHDHEHQHITGIQKAENNNSGAGVWHYMPEFLTNLTSLFQQHHEYAEEDDNVVIVREQGCLTASEILHTFDIKNRISPMGFLHLCPAIIYELDQRHCIRSPSYYTRKSYTEASAADVWLYSSLAVIVISLCGLLSVAVIPIMQKVFYQTLLQFLVGLAIGSLSGDALLHLLPHALSSSSEREHSEEAENGEEAMVWRGLVALGGVYTFFIAERILNAAASYRRKKASAKKYNSSKLMPNGSDHHQLKIGEKLSGYRKASYQSSKEDKETLQMLNETGVFEKLQLQPFEIVPPDDQKDEKPSNHEVFHKETVVYNHTDDNTYSIQIPDHHGHGHTHELPTSISAVAMMVIMGDGLHNFCDGLAIGAAFSSGISGGLSTSVAVFCHELPHELGDFAMLLKTGMSAKQALLYNGLSSVLCFIGMAIGIALGNLTSATQWVFAATAGMFVYIALVDMLPELESASKNSGRRLAIQVLGISIGISIMLLIAIYEHDLKHIIS